MEENNKISINFKIFQNHTITFTFFERIRILFGKKVNVYATIETDKEVNVISGYAHTGVDTFFKKPQGKGELVDDKLKLK